MSKSPHVVEGEASESESEQEAIIATPSKLSPGTKAFVVPGEAPESDDEYKLSPPQPVKDVDVPLHCELNTPPVSPKVVYDSLLHQKLWECNVKLRATVEGLVRHTTNICVEKLTSADKTLLSVQESLRSTNANLTLSRARLKQIHGQLEKANCSSALPTVKI